MASSIRRPRSEKLLLQGVVLRLLPADADPQPDPPAGQQVEGADLLCHQDGLALGEDQHLARQADPLGDGGQLGHQHDRLEDRHLGWIPGAGPIVCR